MATKIQEQVTIFIITNGYLVADRGEQVVHCPYEAAVADRVVAALLEDKGREARKTGRLTKEELDALDNLSYPTQEELAGYGQIGDPGRR